MSSPQFTDGEAETHENERLAPVNQPDCETAAEPELTPELVTLPIWTFEHVFKDWSALVQPVSHVLQMYNQFHKVTCK